MCNNFWQKEVISIYLKQTWYLLIVALISNKGHISVFCSFLHQFSLNQAAFDLELFQKTNIAQVFRLRFKQVLLYIFKSLWVKPEVQNRVENWGLKSYVRT